MTSPGCWPRFNPYLPSVILDSVKGQGVPYLENLSNNHHLRLTAEMKETLNETIRQLEAEHD